MPLAYATPTSARISRKTPPSSFVPKTFTELYENYYVFVLKLCVRQGVPHDDADDAAQFIFEKLMASDMLERFDPEMVNHGRKAVFSTLLSSFVFKYTMNFSKRQQTLQNREQNLVDLEVGGDSDGRGTQSYLDVFYPDFDDEYSEIDSQDTIDYLRRNLALVHPGRKDNQCNLVALFDEILEHNAEYGKYDSGLLSERFGVTRTTIHKWLGTMRMEISTLMKALDVD